MQRVILALVALFLASAVATADKTRQVRFVGIHPIPKSEGGGICYIEGPHVHLYAADKLQYRDHRGSNYFVGDPVAYGYDGKRYAYKGPHPIHVEAVVEDDDPDVEYCYIEGPHFHYFAPPEGPDFQLTGDAYFYVGAPPPPMIEARPAYVGINTVYRPMVYERPVVTFEAPVGWIGARAEFVGPGVAVVAPAAVVVPPRAGVAVDVAVPMPSVHVDVGVGIGGGVIVGAPPAVIVHDRPVIIEERVKVKHDNGWHRGHHK